MQNRSIYVPAAVIILSVVLITSAFAQTMLKVPPADGPFQRTWARTDKPVVDGQAFRTWMWGPDAFTGEIPEPYAEAPSGSRTVQYFDKSRMEDNAYRSIDPWDVTNGLLVVEMVEGHFQVGDAAYDESPNPAEINIAGDPNERPTYADINQLAIQDSPAATVGAVLTATFTENNTIGNDPGYANAGVTAAMYVPDTDHSIASPFWTFMSAQGVIWANGQYVTTALFQNPYYATGFPITEAYWSIIAVGGIERPVLWQCFERRCLTYTATNDPSWQVEAGNVGQHYYRWRYEGDGGIGATPTQTATATPTTPTVTASPDDGIPDPGDVRLQPDLSLIDPYLSTDTLASIEWDPEAELLVMEDRHSLSGYTWYQLNYTWSTDTFNRPSDYSVSADIVTLTRDKTSQSRACIVVRMRYSVGYPASTFVCLGAGGTVSAWTYVLLADEELQRTTPDIRVENLNVGEGATNHLEVVVEWGHAWVMINGQLALDFDIDKRNDNYANGVGLAIVHWAPGSYPIKFGIRNLVVRDLQ